MSSKKKDMSAAGSHAILSVEYALKQVQDDLEQKKRENQYLHKKNAELEDKLDATAGGLKEAVADLKAKDLALHQANERNEELYRSLAAEHAAFTQLKDDSKETQNKLQMLQNQNLELLNHQVDEKNVRNELTAALQVMQKEITVLEVEKQKYKQIFKELEAKLRVEMDSHAVEKEQWKDKNLLFMRKLQTEEKSVRVHKRKAEELAKNVVRLSEENMGLQQQVVTQEQRLQEVVAEYTEIKEQYHQTVAVVKRQEAEKKEVIESADKNKQELKKSSDQLRLMAEKVFSLLGQLTKMDEWKVEALNEQKDAKARVLSCEGRIEQLTRQLETANKYRIKLEASNKMSQDRLIKQRQALLTLKQKYIIAEKAQAKIVKQLKTRESGLSQTSSKLEHVQARLKNEQLAREQERKVLSELDAKVNELEESAAAMRNQVAILELTKTRHQEIIKHKDLELQALREKESYYEKLQQTINNVRESDLKARLVSSGSVENAEARTEQFRTVLRSRAGQNVVDMLKKLHVPERALVAWSESPDRLVQGLNTLFVKLKATSRVAAQPQKTQVDKGDRLRGMARKNKELLNRIATLENYKTKSLMRLMSAIATTSNKDPASTVEGHADEEEKLNQIVDAGALQLSDNGIEDREILLLSSSLRNNSIITEIDLRGNRVSNDGLLTILRRAISPDNTIRIVDLQENHVTLDGLEAAASFLFANSHPGRDKQEEGNGIREAPHVRSARLQQEDRKLMPILEIGCSSGKTLIVDLRYNRLQQSQGRKSMASIMSRITDILSRCEGGDQEPGLSALPASQDTSNGAWESEDKENKPLDVDALAANVRVENLDGDDVDPRYMQQSKELMDKLLADNEALDRGLAPSTSMPALNNSSSSRGTPKRGGNRSGRSNGGDTTPTFPRVKKGGKKNTGTRSGRRLKKSHSQASNIYGSRKL